MSRSELIQLARSTYGVSENGYIVVGRSGVIAAAQPAMSLLWNWSLPNADAFGVHPLVLERLRLQWTCITPFAVPVTAGRGLAFCKIPQFSSAGGGGTAPVNNILAKNVLTNATFGQQLAMANTTAITPPASPPVLTGVFAQLCLTGYGLAGATVDKEWRWTSGDAQMISFAQSEVIGLICPNAMDIVGTFELIVEAELQSVPSDLPQP